MSLPVSAQQNPHLYYSDRFVFIGTYINRPCLVSVEFRRGYAPSSANPYIAEFQGHFGFADKWHHLKNGNYLESPNPFDLTEVPSFQPCLLAWGEPQKTGAINHDHQEIAFLLQFRNIEFISEEKVEGAFLLKEGVGDAFLQFQGTQIPGRLFYQRMECVGYNPYVNNFTHIKRLNFQQFFLVGENNRLWIIRGEKDSNRLRNQWMSGYRYTYMDEKGQIYTSSSPFHLDWSQKKKENDPANPFREYPVGWRMGSDSSSLSLESSSFFYWFNYGLYSLEGTYNGQPVMGLGELIRGK